MSVENGHHEDLREFLALLEADGLLLRVKSPVNVLTDVGSMIAWQFHGLPEEQRKALLFENVISPEGVTYDASILSGLYASRRIYAMGIGCNASEVNERWVRALRNPVEPTLVSTGSCKEEIHRGAELEDLGLDEVPIMMGNPGYDAAPWTTAGWVLTKDVETGVRNVGAYVLMKTGRTEGLVAMGLSAHTQQHISLHWFKARDRGRPLEAALAIGTLPVVGMTAGVKIPYGVDELAVSGGLAGASLKLVKCETVDLEVPAESEMVIEGEISTEQVQGGGFHGEYQGYVSQSQMRPLFKVKCITHRKHPIYVETATQKWPCDASNIKEYGNSGLLYSKLKYEEKVSGLLDFVIYEQFNVVRIKSDQTTQETVSKITKFIEEGKDYLTSQDRKFIVIVDEDVDSYNLNEVIWALSWTVQPHRDMKVIIKQVPEHVAHHDPSSRSSAEIEAARKKYLPDPVAISVVVMNATRKWSYSPVALPGKEFMDRAMSIWEKEGLPELHLHEPYYGRELGDYWREELREQARNAAQGRVSLNWDEWKKTGKKITA